MFPATSISTAWRTECLATDWNKVETTLLLPRNGLKKRKKHVRTRGRKCTPLTCGIRKSLSRLATWMEVTLEAAPTTPEMTFRTVLLHWYSASSMLLMDPGTNGKAVRTHAAGLFQHCQK